MTELQEFKAILFDLSDNDFDKVVSVKNTLLQAVATNGVLGIYAITWLGFEAAGMQVQGVNMLEKTHVS